MKTLKQWLDAFRLWQFRMLIKVLDRDFSTVYQAFNKARVMNLASEVAQMLYMQTLDKEHLIHCAKCGQRFGLKRLGEQYLCVKHAGNNHAVQLQRTA